MVKKNLLLAGIFILFNFGLSNFLAQPAQDEDVMSNILSSLAKDEVIIEFANYEENKEIISELQEGEKREAITEKQLSKTTSCISKFKEKIHGFASSQDTQGIFMMDGIVTEKTDDYVVFEGSLKFISSDKSRRWEISPRLKLIKGKEQVVGELNNSRGKWKASLKATW